VNKKNLVDSIVRLLRTEMELLANTAKSAHDEATHDEELHKNQFETPGLETSVIAEGQVKVATDLRESVDAFRTMALPEFGPGDPIGLGALVEIESGGEKSLYFVGPRAGGLEVVCEAVSVSVITLHSLLCAKLIGRRAGDILPAGAGRNPMRIVSVQ
jgi:hypothetical protein